MFKSASDASKEERLLRERDGQVLLKFGVDYLDDALRGIAEHDLVLLGSPSGSGKTQLCTIISLANMENERKVHYIALEAHPCEIEQRLKFPLVAERYFADENRPQLPVKLNFPDWKYGLFKEQLKPYEDDAEKFFASAYKNLMLYYKQDKFGVTELIEAVVTSADETDLILIDHYHYFDFEDENENRAAREIAKCLRDLVLNEGKPIVLVAHLRKREGGANEDLVPRMEDFHGGSDLYKIATKVVTMSGGRPAGDNLFETYFRVVKNRDDSSVNRYCAVEYFNPKSGGYDKGKYKISWADSKRSKGFGELARELYPYWARRSSMAGSVRDSAARAPRTVPNFAPGAGGARLV